MAYICICRQFVISSHLERSLEIFVFRKFTLWFSVKVDAFRFDFVPHRRFKLKSALLSDQQIKCELRLKLFLLLSTINDFGQHEV